MTRSENIYTCSEDYVYPVEACPNIPLQCKVSFIMLALENTFSSNFYSKNGHTSVENYSSRTKFKLVRRTTCKKLFLKFQDSARFPSWCLDSGNVFLGYFYSKNSITQQESTLLEKKVTLFWTTYKKIFLKYQDSASFPSLCLAPEYAFLRDFYFQKRP